MRKIAFISGLYYNERLLLYTSLLDRLKENNISVDVYTTVKSTVAVSKEFQSEKFFNIKEIYLPTKIFTSLKKILNYSWDYYLKESKTKHIFSFEQNKDIDHSYKFIASIISKLKLTKLFNSFVIFFISFYCHFFNKFDSQFLKNISKYDAVIFGWPYRDYNVLYANLCKKHKIPTIALIAGFDNITSKSRFLFKYDFYFAWSEQMINEMSYFYPYINTNKIFVIGNPQYELLKIEKYKLPKNIFFNNLNLDSNRLTILYAMGTPNQFREDYMLLDLLEKLNTCDFIDKVQFVVRPHPAFFDVQDWDSVISECKFPVFVQKVSERLTERDFPSVDSLKDWVNAVSHCDVLINAASTITFDAIYCKKPVINVNYDLNTDENTKRFITVQNSRYLHALLIVNSGAVHIVNSTFDMINCISDFVSDYPKKYSEKEFERLHLLKKVCSLDFDIDPLDNLISSINKILNLGKKI